MTIEFKFAIGQKVLIDGECVGVVDTVAHDGGVNLYRVRDGLVDNWIPEGSLSSAEPVTEPAA